MRRLRGQAWNAYLLLATAQLTLGIMMEVARAKGFVLPCGSLLGCGASIHRSPRVAGLYLTQYAVLYPVILIGLLAFGLRMWAVTMTLVANAGGLAFSFIANGYNYVANDTICAYCLGYALSALLGLLLVLAMRDGSATVNRDWSTVLTLAGLGASACFLWFRHEVDLSRRTGAVMGVSVADLLDDHGLSFGSSDSSQHIVCFYSPTCEICKDEIARLMAAAASPASDLCVHLRAVPPEEDRVAYRLAALMVHDAHLAGARHAVESVLRSKNLTALDVERLTVKKSDVQAVEQDARLAKALAISRTPTCISVRGGVAEFAPCQDLPRRP